MVGFIDLPNYSRECKEVSHYVRDVPYHKQHYRLQNLAMEKEQ